MEEGQGRPHGRSGCHAGVGSGGLAGDRAERLKMENEPCAYLCFLWKLHHNDGKE